jgi:hypothetical protein
MVNFHVEVIVVAERYKVLVGSLKKERVPLTGETLCTMSLFLKVLQSSRGIRREVSSSDVAKNFGTSA